MAFKIAGIGSGARTWSLTRDRRGQRTYKIKHRVETDTSTEGPGTALETPGLPTPGSIWDVDDEFDPWAYFTQDATVTPVPEIKEGELVKYYDIEQIATTEPVQICSEEYIENPLLYPDRIRGHFNKFQEEATFDRFGKPVYNSAYEQIRGAGVEFDANRGVVTVEQNVADLEYDLISELLDCVNDEPLWGLPARCVKLSNCTWERKYHGNCEKYYTRVLEFETNRKTFDRSILDEGTKVLRGKWVVDNVDPNFKEYVYAAGLDPKDPRSYIRYVDFNQNASRVLLNGAGKIAIGVNSGLIANVTDDPLVEVTTETAHGLTTGTYVHIQGVLGISEANGTWLITVTSPNSFILDGVSSVADYLGGGGWQQGPPDGPAYIRIEKYRSANLLLLNPPVEL